MPCTCIASYSGSLGALATKQALGERRSLNLGHMVAFVFYALG